MAHERPESLPLGRLVVEQRRRLSLSQTDVTRRVRNAAKAEGRQSGATKQWVSEIERTGRVPHPDGLRWLAVAIEVPIERLVVAADQQVRARSKPRDGQQPTSERTQNWQGQIEQNVKALLASRDGFKLEDEIQAVYGETLGLARQTHVHAAIKRLWKDGRTTTDPRGKSKNLHKLVVLRSRVD
jgi:hypothetical protein